MSSEGSAALTLAGTAEAGAAPGTSGAATLCSRLESEEDEEEDKEDEELDVLLTAEG